MIEVPHSELQSCEANYVIRSNQNEQELGSWTTLLTRKALNNLDKSINITAIWFKTQGKI